MSKSTKPKGYKRIPDFWWDFGKDNQIIIESTDPDYPIVYTVKYEGDAEPAMLKADKIIDDYKSGRKNYRKGQ